MSIDGKNGRYSYSFRQNYPPQDEFQLYLNTPLDVALGKDKMKCRNIFAVSILTLFFSTVLYCLFIFINNSEFQCKSYVSLLKSRICEPIQGKSCVVRIENTTKIAETTTTAATVNVTSSPAEANFDNLESEIGNGSAVANSEHNGDNLGATRSKRSHSNDGPDATGTNMQPLDVQLDEANFTKDDLDSFETDEALCGEDERLCEDKNSCAHKKAWCDGIVQCGDGSDEKWCTCKERLLAFKLCDGYPDCPDGEDEKGCFGCPEDSFVCDKFRYQFKGKCISLKKRCDNYPDCLDGKDEYGCELLTEDVKIPGKNNTILQSFAVGYLHKNWKGRWYPACISPKEDSEWPISACKYELGTSGKPTVERVPRQNESNAYVSHPYLLWKGNGKNPEIVSACHGHVLRVTCPQNFCGTRSVDFGEEEEKRERRWLQDNENGKGTRGRREYLHIPAENGTKDDVAGEDGKLRIVGGRVSHSGSWPWVVAMYKNGIFHCGGVILDPTWIITAAHCVHSFSDNYYEIRAGISRRYSYSPMDQISPVDIVVVHEAYNRFTMDNDLALLKLRFPLKYNKWVRPTCLPTLNGGPFPGQFCTAVGWGATIEHGPDPDKIHEVEVPIMDSCIHKADVNEDEICAGYPMGGRDTCQGDSGGPLLCKMLLDVTRWFVAGIVSHGEGCARPHEPGVYTKVTRYFSWILERTSDRENVVFPAQLPLRDCPGFVCADGIRCIARSRICDKVVDCMMGEDELACDRDIFAPASSNFLKMARPRQYETNHKNNRRFRASLKKLIKSDENVGIKLSVDKNKTTEAERVVLIPIKQKFMDEFNATTFECKKLKQRLPVNWKCDGESDCEDGSDEWGCICADFLLKENATRICDGRLDCKDGSDESKCRSIKICKKDEFLCYRSQHCIERKFKCDGYNDCMNSEDEENCYALTDGNKVEMDEFGGIPMHRDNKGILARNVNGTWRPYCCAPEENETDLYRSICQSQGYNDYESKISITVLDKMLPEGRENISVSGNSRGNCIGLELICSPSRGIEEASTLPWIARIYSNGRFSCLGVLISPEWISTNADCHLNYEAGKTVLTASLGWSVESPETVVSTNERLVRIANVLSGEPKMLLARLQHQIQPSPGIRPLSLPWSLEESSFLVYDSCVVATYNVKTRKTYSLPLIKMDKADDKRSFYLSENKTAFCSTYDPSSRYSDVICMSPDSQWNVAATFTNDDVQSFCQIRQMLLHTRNYEPYLKFLLDSAKNFNASEDIMVGCDGVRCDLGSCVEWDSVCDGKVDCRSGEDESDKSCRKKLTQAQVRNINSCWKGEFRCGGDRPKCVEMSAMCDGRDDCEDGRDEDVCDGSFNCAMYLNATDPSRICDGRQDCYDKSDEMHCPCKENSFICHSTNEMCISMDFVGDGEADCPDNSDEKDIHKLENDMGKTKEGFVMIRRQGVWRKACVGADFTALNAPALCSHLGFGTATAHNYTVPGTWNERMDPVVEVKINSRLEVKLKVWKSKVTLDDEPCQYLYIKCK